MVYEIVFWVLPNALMQTIRTMILLYKLLRFKSNETVDSDLTLAMTEPLIYLSYTERDLVTNFGVYGLERKLRYSK